MSLCIVSLEMYALSWLITVYDPKFKRSTLKKYLSKAIEFVEFIFKVLCWKTKEMNIINYGNSISQA